MLAIIFSMKVTAGSKNNLDSVSKVLLNLQPADVGCQAYLAVGFSTVTGQEDWQNSVTSFESVLS